MGWIRRWLLKKKLIHDPLNRRAWQHTLDRVPLLAHLEPPQKARLQQLTREFLLEKVFSGVQGVTLNDDMKTLIAAQACLPILNMSMDAYSGWVEVIVYPDSFHVPQEFVDDETGVVSEESSLLSGEAWGRGPVILSWSDVQEDYEHPHPGHNVVIHEFAHKLDMQNGRANGMPPLHPDMPIEQWTHALSTAYEQLTQRLEHHHVTDINPYAGTNPAEFFAVLSEYFFTAPYIILEDCPQVYDQLQQYYRLDTRHWYPRHARSLYR